MLAAVGALALGLSAGLSAARAQAAEPERATGDPVLIWNDQTNRAIQETSTDPFQASRALALESIAVLDTVRSIASAPAFLVRLPGARDLKPDIAAAAAAHAMLSQLFPARRPALDATLAASLANEPAGPARDRAVAFGKAVADAVFARRADDGWNAAANGATSGAANGATNGATGGAPPGEWRPTPPDFAPPQDPQWGAMTPFVMTKPSQFRPAGPPALGSAAFREAAASVAALGAAQSADRTAAQTDIARFWSDGAGTYGPAGHWNAITASLVPSAGLSLEAEAELFAELNVAIADAAIAVADAKYNYRFWRPVTAIREGAAGAPPNPDWSPLLETPNHPSYISGHSSFSGAAATVLTARFGPREFSFAGASAPGMTRDFTSFQQAAEEAAMSREYGGIHYAFDNADGLATGRAVGAWTLAAFRRIAAEDRGPAIVMDHPGQPRTQAPAGFALDNFSPVKTVTVRVDGGQRFNVAVDDRGRFALPPLHPGQFGQMQAVLVATSATGHTATARLVFDGAADGNMVTAPFTVQ
jgi:membrane-associated phospholipid phosphatase